ncbi:hypothetical protein BHE74_00036561 [Ensete ventricosum]|nr:hypothetical protein BHE74_00036561 [Ensete ventricosum]
MQGAKVGEPNNCPGETKRIRTLFRIGSGSSHLVWFDEFKNLNPNLPLPTCASVNPCEPEHFVGLDQKARETEITPGKRREGRRRRIEPSQRRTQTPSPIRKGQENKNLRSKRGRREMGGFTVSFSCSDPTILGGARILTYHFERSCVVQVTAESEDDSKRRVRYAIALKLQGNIRIASPVYRMFYLMRHITGRPIRSGAVEIRSARADFCVYQQFARS